MSIAIGVSARSIKSIDRRAMVAAPSDEKLLTSAVHKRHQFTQLKDLRRRCIQVTGGACKTMEAYNLAKLQQSAMPMDWGKRSGVELDSAAVNDAAAAAAEKEVMMDARDAASPQETIKDNEAKALLFFLRPPSKESN